VTWLVDGMNVIGSRPNGWWRDRRGAMRALVAQLDRLAATLDQPLTVVLDGRPFDLRGERVDVRFASRAGRNAADDDLAELAGEGDTVVTSDRELAGRVRARGAEVIGVRAFRERLDRA
jgi:uncharacterized protein YaiI (UPF0178 family)